MISDGNCHLRSEMNEVKSHRTNDHMQLLSLHLDMNNPAKSEQIFQWKQQCFHAAGRLPKGGPFWSHPGRYPEATTRQLHSLQPPGQLLHTSIYADVAMVGCCKHPNFISG